MNIDDTARIWSTDYDHTQPIPFVKHCGKAFEDITDRRELYDLTSELTDAEKQSKYAKYYYLGPACPVEENIRMTEYDTPIDAAEAFMLEEYAAKMNQPECHHIKTGYCVMQNGVGFATACTRGEGISASVMSNFIDHFNPPEDLYYKVWLPGAHVRHYENMAVEDLGFGMTQLRFVEGLNAQKVGFSEENVKDPYYIGITGANILCQPLHQPDAEPIYMSELCYYRQMPDCYEQRVTFWIGMHFKDGKSEIHLPKGKAADEILVLNMAKHSVWETATFMRNILEFGKDCGVI